MSRAFARPKSKPKQRENGDYNPVLTLLPLLNSSEQQSSCSCIESVRIRVIRGELSALPYTNWLTTHDPLARERPEMGKLKIVPTVRQALWIVCVLQGGGGIQASGVTSNANGFNNPVGRGLERKASGSTGADRCFQHPRSGPEVKGAGTEGGTKWLQQHQQ